jgi:hypothetical protein
MYDLASEKLYSERLLYILWITSDRAEPYTNTLLLSSPKLIVPLILEDVDQLTIDVESPGKIVCTDSTSLRLSYTLDKWLYWVWLKGRLVAPLGT